MHDEDIKQTGRICGYIPGHIQALRIQHEFLLMEEILILV